MTSEMIDGRAYQRAISYALGAVPTDDDHAHLQHVTFIGNRIVGADGRRRQDGYLPIPFDRTISVARISVVKVLKSLEYANWMAKNGGGTFSVTHEDDTVVIHYGALSPLSIKLEIVDTDGHPPDPRDWVPEDAPVNAAGFGRLSNDYLIDALRWYKSWDKDHGTTETRGGQDGGPIRCDVAEGGRRVATAFVLPEDHPDAELCTGPDLFNRDRPYLGRSNLALDLSGDGAPAPEPVILKISTGGAEVEINVTGLGDPQALLCTGPCPHRDTTDACLPCTQDKVDAAKQKDVAPPKRRGRKPKAEAPISLAPDVH